METLVRALGRFVSRDIPRVLGGMSVVISFLLLFDLSIPYDASTPVILFAAGVAYVLGYLLEGILSMTPLINTSVVVQAPKLMQRLYRSWARRPFSVPTSFDSYAEYFRMYAEATPESTAAIERIITLKHIGTTMGANWLVCSLLLGIKCGLQYTHLYVALAVMALVASLALITLGWLQALQVNQALYNRYITRQDSK